MLVKNSKILKFRSFFSNFEYVFNFCNQDCPKTSWNGLELPKEFPWASYKVLNCPRKLNSLLRRCRASCSILELPEVSKSILEHSTTS